MYIDQNDSGPEYGTYQSVVLVELIDHDDDDATQYLFRNRGGAMKFIFAHVRAVFGDDPAYRRRIEDMQTLDQASDILGDARKDFAIKDWNFR